MAPPAFPTLEAPPPPMAPPGRPPAPDATRLTAHLQHCAAARGRLHRMRGVLAAMDGLVQPRFLSTLMALALAATAVLLLLTASA